MNRPLIAPSELETLTAQFGPQPHQHATVIGDGWWEEVRRSLSRRRGEVLMVIQRPGGEILVHTKAFYPPEAYRLPTGGIGWEETAWAALYREIDEETGLPVRSAMWWGLITYTLYPSEGAQDRGIPFVSFVFYVRTEGEPRVADRAEQIADFRWVSPEALPEIARRLESLDAPWRGWGAFRAIGHRFVWEHHREQLLLSRIR
ncbi:RNA pyrophosphohydrolase [Candidatus Thermoflexus japonica]|uniref:RNA pyrophosphohydrolase n=1 Tax=Candidatus Thermoflexus japonica TaxID=2035417 RepID=A0A2H5Y3D8_9CHLR|nr:RNA pyrophosphohydrolase [Candidatus Thermoflexus japonica]